MECQPLWRPVFAAIARVTLHRRANALLLARGVGAVAAGLGAGWGDGVAQVEPLNDEVWDNSIITALGSLAATNNWLLIASYY